MNTEAMPPSSEAARKRFKPAVAVAAGALLLTACNGGREVVATEVQVVNDSTASNVEQGTVTTIASPQETIITLAPPTTAEANTSQPSNVEAAPNSQYEALESFLQDFNPGAFETIDLALDPTFAGLGAAFEQTVLDGTMSDYAPEAPLTGDLLVDTLWGVATSELDLPGEVVDQGARALWFDASTLDESQLELFSGMFEASAAMSVYTPSN